jgi:hypothetical protein
MNRDNRQDQKKRKENGYENDAMANRVKNTKISRSTVHNANATSQDTGGVKMIKEDIHQPSIKNTPIIRQTHKVGIDYYLIEKTFDESLDVYYKRVGYIIRKKSSESNDALITDIDNVSNLSMIWRNKNIFGMNYPSTVLRRL